MNRFYPQLSDLITVDDLPDFLDFAKDGLNTLLSSIHYKNFQYSKSHRGDSSFFKIDIISKNVGLDLPFGLRFVLNPDVNGDTSISSFPVTLQYQWEIFSFLNSFNLSGVSLDPDGIFQLGLGIFKVTDAQVVAHTINFFVTPADGATKYQQIVDDINGLYPAADLSIPTGQTPSVTLIANLISDNQNIPTSVSELMFALYLLNTDLATTESHIEKFYSLIVPGGIENFINGLIKPNIQATLSLTAGIEFPTTILQPVDVNGVVIPNEKSVFQFAEATFYFDTQSGIGSQLTLGGTLIPTYAEIANSGIIISFTNAKLDLSKTTNIPEATAAGYPVDFIGLYIQQASVSINKFGKDDPNKPSASISVKNLFIGTGGVSGSFALTDNGLINKNFGSFSAELDTFNIAFRQNSITSCSIGGTILLNNYTINGQPAKIGIQAQIKDNGDFSITALFQPNMPPISLAGIFDLHIRTLTIGDDAKGFYIEVSGVLDFTADIPLLGDVLPSGINIKKLRIYDDGHLEFSGGGLTLPVGFKLHIGPVNLEVTKMSLGSYSKKLNGVDRNYCYFGFDGMVNLGTAGITADGNGIKYYFTVDDGDGKPFDSFLSIDQIAIDITVPAGASEDDADFILAGSISMKNPDPNASSSSAGTEYGGSILVKIPPIGITGSAQMRLNPKIPSFVVDLGLELSTPLPLGPTGLGIYGFRGLLGEHYVPSKSAVPSLANEPDASWWDYYKAKSTFPPFTEGIAIDKFADKPGFSIGAGVSIATSFDSGLVFSSKLFLLLGLPSVFLIQGQAGILQSRIGLDDKTDPPFSALVAIDSTSFRGNLSVNYNLPEGGAYNGLVFELQGMLDLAFFFNNASGWYLNLGKDQPDSARIQAKVLDLFKGYAYVMLSAQGIKAGAGAGFNFNKTFGPVSVGIGANIDLAAFISFKPVQIGGSIQFGGYANLKVFWFKLGLSVQVALAVEAPHPFNIQGSLQVKIHTPWPLPNVKFSLNVSWHFNSDRGPLLAPVPIMQLPDPTTGYSPAVALNILSLETFPVNYISQQYTGNVTIPPPGDSSWQYNFDDATQVMQVTIPLDSYIDIELLKPVLPGAVMLGGANSQLPMGYSDLLPPVKGLSAQVKHVYTLTGLNIYAWDDNGSGGGTWVPYQIYEAVTAIVNDNTGPDAVDLSALAPGYWQFMEANKYNKIRLLSQTMFSYANQTNSISSDLDALNFQPKDLFCYDTVSKTIIVNWKGESVDTAYEPGQSYPVDGVSFQFNGLGGTVETDPASQNNRLLLAPSSGSLLITLPVAVTTYTLTFGPNQNDIAIYPVVTEHIFLAFGQTIPLDVDQVPSYLTNAQENKTVSYDNLDQPVNKIRLVFNTAYPLDFDGDLLIGGYFQLPDQFLPVTTPPFHHEIEADKALLFATIFNKSFTQEDVLSWQYQDTTGVVAQWPMDSSLDKLGTSNGIISGIPDLLPGFYQRDASGDLTLHEIYNFTSNADGLLVPFNPVIKIESGSFSFAVTADFDPFSGGISTLLSKVVTDERTGYRKGFALHLYQDNPGYPGAIYNADDTVPGFIIWATFYNGLSVSGINISDLYTLDYTTNQLASRQYRNILVSVDREADQVAIYIDRVLKISSVIPAELAVPDIQPAQTYINELSYLTEVLQRSQDDSQISPGKVINEIQILSNSINKTIQPVWRPNTTFAVTVQTQDTVNGDQTGAIAYTQIFGFRTAGPVGHFQQQSAVYQALAAQDKADQFKLADLKSYIDYNRSFPDAQGRYDLSKPVFYHDPQINLYFLSPYINAMYANWDTYQGLAAVESSLSVSLIDPSGAVLSPELVWVQLPEVQITIDNYKTLPPDQQVLFLMDLAASEGGCNDSSLSITSKKKQGTYQFTDLIPNKLYTAIFNAIYQPAGADPQTSEVHRFSFISSRFATYQDQASSFILDSTTETYAMDNLQVGFTADQISGTLIPLLDDNPDNDPAAVLNYAVKYDRLVYGGLQLKNLQTTDRSIFELVINTDPSTSSKQLLGLLIRNPEPFNDPKMPAEELVGTIELIQTLPDGTVVGPDQFIYTYARDTSAVFVTNAMMSMPAGSIVVSFRYKIFNGTDYDTEHQDYTSPAITLTF